MKKIYIYPQVVKGQLKNPYVFNYSTALEKFFKIVRIKRFSWLPQEVKLILCSLKADIYVLNWLENAGHEKFSLLRSFFALVSLTILHLRKCKVVWMFHNIHPHKGENFWTRVIQKLLFAWSSIIITHSSEALDYAKNKSRRKIVYKPHPITPLKYDVFNRGLIQCDFFLWGQILPYKGVLEFISHPLCQTSKKCVYILGNCPDKELKEKISEKCTGNIIWDNRKADFCEIAAQCKISRYVVFPYVGESISSSGVLMDTLQLGGIPVGPNRGAFADLAKEGCCITYNHIDEVFKLPMVRDETIVNPNKIEQFINDNTWESFGKWLFDMVASQEHVHL